MGTRRQPPVQEPAGNELKPPRVAEELLRHCLPPGPVGESILGDLHEEYCDRARAESARAAAKWYRRQAGGIAWRAVRDRVCGSGPFMSHASLTIDNSRGDAMPSRILRAVRYGAKGLARSPQFTVAAVLTLALAIGTNTAIFSVVQGVLLKPLPFAESEDLVMLRHTAPGVGYNEIGISPGLYLHYRAAGGAFESSGIYTEVSVNVTGDDEPPARLDAVRASRDVFTTLGVAPVTGRIFAEDEDQPGAAGVVLLSHELWRERFGGDAAITGRSVQIDGEPHTVVGVMPESFDFPTPETRLWLPLALDTTQRAYGAFSYQAIARLHPAMDLAATQARLEPLLGRLGAAEGSSDFRAFIEAGRLAPVVKPLKTEIVGDVSQPLWILLGTVAFVFLIACANVTNLFLVRAEARQKEMAVRAALGGGRSELIGHYAAESLLIAGAGGALGLALSWTALRALLRMAPPDIPRLHEVAIDPLVLAFTLVVTMLAAVLLGILPTLRLTSPDLLGTLSRSARGATSGRERNRARQVLVVAQTALALVLLVGSGLMVRSFMNLRAVDPGFDPANAITFRLSLPASTYPDSSVAHFHEQLLTRLRALPGVDYAGATSHPPLAGCCSGTAHVVEDHAVEPGQLPPMFWYSTVSEGYFEAMRIRLVAGRTFDASEQDPARHSIVVNRNLAQRFWPDGDPLGRRIRLSGDSLTWYTIVGVVGDVRAEEIDNDPVDMVYYPVAAAATGQARNMTYVLRTPYPDAVAPRARAEVWSLDGNLPIAASAKYEKILADDMVRLSFTMIALIAASAIALVLGAIGLYSVISYIVTQRTNEIGIRMALGARPGQVRRQVVLQGVRLTALGLLIGTAGALILTRLMQSMLFETAPHDPATFLAVSAFLAAIALLAAYVPATRASRIDPALSLKAD